MADRADFCTGKTEINAPSKSGPTLHSSSANLTEYALTLNMELGVLISGGPAPARVAAHLGRLVEMGVFRRVEA